MHQYQCYKTWFGVFSSVLLLTACGSGDRSGSDKTSEPAPTHTLLNQQTLELDASSQTEYVYYKLDDLSRVMPQDAATDTDWDIGFRRNTIMLNGGVAGSGAISGALAATPSGAYDEAGNASVSVLTNDMSGLAQDTFNSVTSAEGLNFISEAHRPALPGNGGWYEYDPGTHQVQAKDDRYWIVRSAEGDSFAQLRVIALTTTRRLLDSITLGVGVQHSGETVFSSETQHTLMLTGTAACFDLEIAAVVECTHKNWDLYIDAAFAIYLNSGIHGGQQGGAFGPLSAADLSGFSHGGAVPHWSKDASGGVFSDFSWYAYNLLGMHKLWPNYRVYVIQDGDTHYKLQVQSYYDPNGISGHITVKVQQI